jgi:exopolyphosphatase/guanosine-5'-triphosphate,3'-diphosphate pyrophosphatase
MANGAASVSSAPGAAFPLDAVAPTLLVEAARSAGVILKQMGDRGVTSKRVHELRVATRRLDATVALVAPCIGQECVDRLTATTNGWRRALGRVRSLDIAIQWLRELAPGESVGQHTWTSLLVDAVKRERVRRRRRLEDRVARHGPDRLCKDFARAARSAVPPQSGPRLYSDAAIESVSARSAEVARLLTQVTKGAESIHAVRVGSKRLKYLLELVAGCLPSDLCERALQRLGAEQAALGILADMESHLRVLESLDLNSRAADAERQHACVVLSQLRDAQIDAIVVRLQGGGLASVIEELVVWARDATGSVPVEVTVAESKINATGRLEPREDRLAVIDVGSNSVRLLVVELLQDGTYRTLDDEKETTRLGQGLVATGMLSTVAMVRTANCIARMRGIAQGYGVSRLRVIGTSAVRDATNQREFLALVRDTAVVTLEVLSEEDEARHAHRSASAGFDLTDVPAAVVDIGGGSTEIVLSTKGVVEHVCSIPIGAVRVSEMFATSAGMGGMRQMRRYVSKCLRQALPNLPFAPTVVVGTGGTFTAIAALVGAKEQAAGRSADRAFGYELRRSEVRHALDRLGSMSLRERMRLPRLSPERADIIVGGAAIAEGVLRHLNVNRLRVHDKGVRDGLVLSMISEREKPQGTLVGTSPASRTLAAARRFAEACRYEKAHSEQVAVLSVSIFDQLASLSLLPKRSAGSEARLLLEVAAVLHDIGYLVNYAGHHKHSLRLIMNGDLPGLSARQTAIVANVARYHRRAEPDVRHAPYERLAKSDRRIVRQLAGVLRVADGLDRAHSQAVESVTLRLGPEAESPRELVLAVRATERPTTDLWGAERKMGLLEAELGVRGACQWVLPEPIVIDRSSARAGATNGVAVHA